MDLALLKVDVTKHKLTAVHFGDSAPLRVGDWVIAIGNPFGLGGTGNGGDYFGAGPRHQCWPV